MYIAYTRQAETQSKLLEDILNDGAGAISPSNFVDEMNVLRRGRNAVGKNSRTPKRLGGESGKQNIYQDSTAWEALIGCVARY